MSIIQTILNFFVQFISNPTILIALIALIGLLIRKAPAADCLKGTIKTIVGFTLISSGAGIVQTSIGPLNTMMQGALNMTGTLPVNESFFAVASAQFGAALSGIMVLAFVINIVVARFSKFRFVYLTGHEVMWVSTCCAIAMNGFGFPMWQTILCGGLLTGTYMACAPAMIYNTVCKCTGSKDLAIGHSGMVYYWIAVVVAKLVGNKNSDAEEIKMNKNLNVLRDLTISLSLAMTIVYLAVCALTMVTTPDLAAETLGDTNFIIFSITYGVQFAVSIYVIQAGVRMVVAELVPAFKGIADKFIPNAVPALDIPIIYPYQPNSVLIGFLSATVGAIGAFFLQVALAGTAFELPLILPTLFTSFFYGATTGCLGNKEGGLRGAVISSVITGFCIAIFPAMLIQFGRVLVDGTTFGGADASVFGMFISQFGGTVGSAIFTVVCVVLFLLPMVYSALTKGKPGMTERNEK